jgi:hypothetical protein
MEYRLAILINPWIGAGYANLVLTSPPAASSHSARRRQLDCVEAHLANKQRTHQQTLVNKLLRVANAGSKTNPLEWHRTAEILSCVSDGTSCLLTCVRTLANLNKQARRLFLAVIEVTLSFLYMRASPQFLPRARVSPGWHKSHCRPWSHCVYCGSVGCAGPFLWLFKLTEWLSPCGSHYPPSSRNFSGPLTAFKDK